MNSKATLKGRLLMALGGVRCYANEENKRLDGLPKKLLGCVEVKVDVFERSDEPGETGHDRLSL